MTLRRILPYAVIVIGFMLIYLITMLIHNKDLYGFLCPQWDEVIRNNKIPLQRDLFTYELSCALVVINMLEICTVTDNSFLHRLLKSFLTIILTFIGGWCVYQLMGAPKIWNLYYFPRGAPDWIYCIASSFLTCCCLIILELIQLIFFALFPKEKITRRIPVWLQMAPNPNNSAPL